MCEKSETLKVCGIIGTNLPCTGRYRWNVGNQEKGLKFSVCDAHLAEAIRRCGYPALVDVDSK